MKELCIDAYGAEMWAIPPKRDEVISDDLRRQIADHNAEAVANSLDPAAMVWELLSNYVIAEDDLAEAGHIESIAVNPQDLLLLMQALWKLRAPLRRRKVQ